MKWFSTSSGRIGLQLKQSNAESGYHQGQCFDDIEALRKLPYIAKQLDALDVQLVSDELREYGAWDDEERANHDSNLTRLLWLACGDIVDGLTSDDIEVQA